MAEHGRSAAGATPHRRQVGGGRIGRERAPAPEPGGRRRARPPDDGAPRDRSLRPPGQRDRAAYARLRRREALEALRLAGLAPADVLALGATDQEAARALAPLALELAKALSALRARVVVAHALEGGHPDHDAAALAARAAVALLARRGGCPPRLVEMTSYHAGPAGLVTGAFLPGPQPVWTRRLSDEERGTKRLMLAAYASQRAVLAAFGVEVERFRPATPASLAARPHPAPLRGGGQRRGVQRARARARPPGLRSARRGPAAAPLRGWLHGSVERLG